MKTSNSLFIAVNFQTRAWGGHCFLLFRASQEALVLAAVHRWWRGWRSSPKTDSLTFTGALRSLNVPPESPPAVSPTTRMRSPASRTLSYTSPNTSTANTTSSSSSSFPPPLLRFLRLFSCSCRGGYTIRSKTSNQNRKVVGHGTQRDSFVCSTHSSGPAGHPGGMSGNLWTTFYWPCRVESRRKFMHVVRGRKAIAREYSSWGKRLLLRPSPMAACRHAPKRNNAA